MPPFDKPRVSNQTATRSRKRPWLAIVLTLLIPGLGHLYIREWVRALAWFLTYFLARYLLLPTELVPETFSREAFVEAAQATPVWASLAMFLIAFLCTIEVYILAQRYNDRVARERGADAAACPECGKEVDTELEFCHWCTTRLDDK